MKFYTVCTLPHYHPKDVYRLKSQLKMFYDGDVELFVYTDRPADFDTSVNVIEIRHNLCQRQWYKVDFYKPGFIDGNDPVIVTDLDWLVLDDITDIIDTPINVDEFVAVERWWRRHDCTLDINGGMYKFVPNTLAHAYNVFYSNPRFWQTMYFGPNKIEGEQNFVADVVSLTHKIKLFPGKKIYRHSIYPQTNVEYAERYKEKFKTLPVLDGKFNQQLALVHGRLFYS